jgi:hypothetical protein
MISNALPGAANPKMNNSFVHMARASSYCGWVQDGCLKRPHLTIINGDMKLDKGRFFVGFGVGETPTRN